MLFDIEDDESLSGLLIGQVVAVTRSDDDDAMFILSYADGRRIVLVLEAFGVAMDRIGTC